MKYIFKKLAVLLLACLMAFNGYGQAQPAYNNMQYATGGILEYRGQSMGYAANDPRMHATRYSFGKAAIAMSAGSVVAAAGTGLLVAATAPAWVTVVASAAIFGLVSTAVSLGTDALVKWYFGSGTTPITTVMPAVTGMSFPYQNLSLVTSAQTSNLALTAPYQYRFSGYSPAISWLYNCYGADILSVAACVQAGAQPSFTVAGSKKNLWYGGVYQYPFNSTYIPRLYVFDLSTPATAAASYGYYYFTTLNMNTDTIPDGLRVYCQPGYARKEGSAVCSQYATINTDSSPVTTSNQTMTQAVNALTAAQKAQKVNYDTMASLVNNLWQQAAAKPDYNGIPYVATNPITAAEVQVWANANPSLYPTVGDLVAPITDPNNFAPCTNGSTCAPATASTPTTTTTTTTNGTTTTTTSTVTGTAQPVTVTNKVAVDLGVDPAIGLPTLETAPTASAILSPILNLFPSFKNYVLPSHTATCPAPTFDAFGKHYVMDGHCTLFEQHRSTLYASMMLAFMLVAIFIVLSA